MEREGRQVVTRAAKTTKRRRGALLNRAFAVILAIAAVKTIGIVNRSKA
jgi:hypothetical protein